MTTLRIHPELIVEIAASSAAYDLHTKLRVYQRSGVQEYLAVQMYEQRVDWFALREGVYELSPKTGSKRLKSPLRTRILWFSNVRCGKERPMPSPFPGMDPYLEGEMWQEFHDRLANQISQQLMPLLAPKYVALLAKRYVIDHPALGIFDVPPDRIIYPDVHVVAPPGAPEPTVPAGAGVAIAEPPVELPSLLPEEVPVMSVEIRDVAERRLVTLIEILSPVNKRGEGVRDYAERRVELLQTRTHLLEIDLLRGGTRIQLASEPPPASYYVYLSRWQRRPWTQIWPIALREPLPTVPVPLLPPDPDVPLALQAAVRACFDLVGYERLLDYSGPPPPPELGQEDAGWVEQTLRAAGLRETGQVRG